MDQNVAQSRTKAESDVAANGVSGITWPEDDPRSAKIVGARPGAPWANWFYDMAGWMRVFAAFAAFLVLIGIIMRRRKSDHGKTC